MEHQKYYKKLQYQTPKEPKHPRTPHPISIEHHIRQPNPIYNKHLTTIQYSIHINNTQYHIPNTLNILKNKTPKCQNILKIREDNETNTQYQTPKLQNILFI